MARCPPNHNKIGGGVRSTLRPVHDVMKRWVLHIPAANPAARPIPVDNFGAYRRWDRGWVSLKVRLPGQPTYAALPS
jgi:hypothetical protein